MGNNIVRDLLVVTLLALLVPFWNLVVKPELKKIPADFTYEANLFSVDNFYDNEKREYSGEEVSKSFFSYSVLSKKDDVLLIQNNFEVSTLAGEKIVDIENVYGIDKYTGRHVYGYGDLNRSGYLFAPRGLTHETKFRYWHVNYPAPADLKFVKEEEVKGLLTYKYETEYEGYDIDQTEFLTHLEGVPEERGVKLEPLLEVWFEPVTGMMIKYKDNTVAYYYDVETGERLEPWNRFSNEFADSTVDRMVMDISYLKYKFLVLDYFVPGLALALIVVIGLRLLWNFLAIDEWSIVKLRKNKMVLILLASLFVFMISGLVYQYEILDVDVKSEYKIAIPVLNSSKITEENIDAFINRLAKNGYVEGQNLDIEFFDAGGDEEVLKSKVREFLKSDLDLIYSVTTPATQVISRETDIVPIVFSLVTHPVEVGLIDSMKESGNNLVGVRHYVPVSGVLFRVTEMLQLNPDRKLTKVAFVRGEGADNSEAQKYEALEVFETQKIDFIDVVASDKTELEAKISEIGSEIDMIYGACDTYVQDEFADYLINYSLDNNKLFVSCVSSLVARGALFSKSLDFANIGEIAADKATLILQGADVQWLENEVPRKRIMHLNLDTAQKLGLEIPDDIYEEAILYGESNQDIK